MHHSPDIWLTAQVKPNSYRKAEANLLRQNFLVFSPKMSSTRTVKGVFIDHIEPLFPGYLFVRFNHDMASLRLINNTYGIAKLIGPRGTGISHVPTEFIAELQKRCDSQGHLQKTEILAPGDVVHIRKGPFTDQVATIEDLLPNDRVTLLMQLLNRETRVTIHMDNIQKY